MRPPLSQRFVDKASSAMVAAIEIFNKPSFVYREETFALLALNAWELLLKARVLAVTGNDRRKLYVYEPRKNKTTGEFSQKHYLRRNRSGTPLSIGIFRAVNVLDQNSSARLSTPLLANLEALMAIRDNAAHYICASPTLAKTTLEIGTASVANFIRLAKDWFQQDFSKSLSLLLPIGFVNPSEAALLTVGADEKNLIRYLNTLAGHEDSTSPFAVAMTVDVVMSRNPVKGGAKVSIVGKDDPDAAKITISYEERLRGFPWDYATLTKKMVEKFPGLKLDASFHAFVKSVKANDKLSLAHYYDPLKKTGTPKTLYSPNVPAAYATYVATGKA